MRKSLVIPVLAAFTFLAPGLARAQSTSETSLQGIPALRVDVDKISPDLGDDGVTQSDIRIDVEKNLTAAHIPLSKASYPFLDVQVSAIKSSIGFYAYSVDVYLYDVVHRTEAPNAAIPACVWHNGSLATTDADEIDTRLQGTIDGILSQFIQDYYAQNMAKLPILQSPPSQPAAQMPSPTAPLAPAPPPAAGQ